MFGAKYSRAKFWGMSVLLLFLSLIVNVMFRVSENVDMNAIDSTGPIITIILVLIALAIQLAWINVLANRIRDYGDNPYLSLLALIPFVNIGMAFCYGIVPYKTSKEAPAGAQPQHQPGQQPQSTTRNQDILEKMKNMK